MLARATGLVYGRSQRASSNKLGTSSGSLDEVRGRGSEPLVARRCRAVGGALDAYVTENRILAVTAALCAALMIYAATTIAAAPRRDGT
jgi:hypothetical protein